jgi:hypothetical protein
VKVEYHVCQIRGIAPIFKGCDLDTRTMSKDEARELELFVESAGFLDAELVEVPPPPANTGESWSMSIEHEGRVHNVVSVFDAKNTDKEQQITRLRQCLSKYLTLTDPE